MIPVPAHRALAGYGCLGDGVLGEIGNGGKDGKVKAAPVRGCMWLV